MAEKGKRQVLLKTAKNLGGSLILRMPDLHVPDRIVLYRTDGTSYEKIVCYNNNYPVKGTFGDESFILSVSKSVIWGEADDVEELCKAGEIILYVAGWGKLVLMIPETEIQHGEYVTTIMHDERGLPCRAVMEVYMSGENGSIILWQEWYPECMRKLDAMEMGDADAGDTCNSIDNHIKWIRDNYGVHEAEQELKEIFKQEI